MANRNLDPSIGKKTQFSKENQPDPSKKGPKGPHLATLLKKALKVVSEDGETTEEMQVIIAMIKKAKSGDIAAIKEVFDRIDGKVTQKNETEITVNPDVEQAREKLAKIVNDKHNSK